MGARTDTAEYMAFGNREGMAVAPQENVEVVIQKESEF